MTFTQAQEEWIAERPASVQAKVRAYPPNQLYLLTTTGQHALIDSYSESLDGTCETCCVTVWMPGLPIAHGVFGIHFTDLVPIEPEGEP